MFLNFVKIKKIHKKLPTQKFKSYKINYLQKQNDQKFKKKKYFKNTHFLKENTK